MRINKHNEKNMVLLKKLINKENSLQLSFLVVIPYLLINTGIFSDEYCFLLTTQDKNFTDLLVPKGFFLIAPIENYTHIIWYHFVKVDNDLVLT